MEAVLILIGLFVFFAIHPVIWLALLGLPFHRGDESSKKGAYYSSPGEAMYLRSSWTAQMTWGVRQSPRWVVCMAELKRNSWMDYDRIIDRYFPEWVKK